MISVIAILTAWCDANFKAQQEVCHVEAAQCAGATYRLLTPYNSEIVRICKIRTKRKMMEGKK